MKKSIFITTTFLTALAVFQANAADFDFEKEKAKVEKRVEQKAQKTGLEMGEGFFGLFDSTGKAVTKSFGDVSNKIEDGTIGPDLSKMEREKHYTEMSTDDIEISDFEMDEEDNTYYFTASISNVTKKMLKIKKDGSDLVVRVKKGKKYVAEVEFQIPDDAQSRKRKIEVTEDTVTISMPKKAEEAWEEPYYGNMPKDKYEAYAKAHPEDEDDDF